MILWMRLNLFSMPMPLLVLNEGDVGSLKVFHVEVFQLIQIFCPNGAVVYSH